MHVADHLTPRRTRALADAARASAASSASAPSSWPPRPHRPRDRRGPGLLAGAPSRSGSPATTPRDSTASTTGRGPGRPPLPRRRDGRAAPRPDRRRPDPRGRRLHPPRARRPRPPRARVRRRSTACRPSTPCSTASATRCLDPRPRHLKADPEAQEEFKKKSPTASTRSPRDHPNKRVEVWFEDEARFGQKGTLTTVWARRGSRPTAVRQTQYDYLWVIAAACPATGAATGIIMPHLDTDVINVFLEEFSRQLAPDVHAVLIWDGAGFHTGGDSGGAGERDADPAAAVLAGAEPDREPLALPAVALLVEPVVRRLGGAEGGGHRWPGRRGHRPRADQVGLRRPVPRSARERMN